jgi:hypothetical protein
VKVKNLDVVFNKYQQAAEPRLEQRKAANYRIDSRLSAYRATKVKYLDVGMNEEVLGKPCRMKGIRSVIFKSVLF